MTSDAPSVWIGLIGVAPMEGNTCLDGARGAYVQATAWAASKPQFCKAVTSALATLAFHPFDFDDVQPFETRFENADPWEEYVLMFEKTRDEQQVMFSEFFVYDEVDA
jgi:hypothetical protein